MMKKSITEVAALAAQFTQTTIPMKSYNPANEQMALEDRLKNIVFDLVDEDELNSYDLEASFKEDFAMDSLDMIELVMVCEKEFRISIADMEWMKVRTVGDMEELVRTHYRPTTAQAA